MPLPTPRLGPLTVSVIGLGCMNLSHAYGAAATSPLAPDVVAAENAGSAA